MVLPVRQVQGLDLADVRNVAVDPGTVQTDEDPQGAGGPTRIFRQKGQKDKLERFTDGQEGRRWGCECPCINV